MSELKPCPFCGGEAELIESDYGMYMTGYAVYCKYCRTKVGVTGRLGESYEWTPIYDTEAEAIAAWNTRADYHGYEQAAIEAWESIKAWNARATNGTLTAEQVKRIHEIIEKHWRDLPAEYDMPEATALPEYSYDWQAIADELNSRAERTCKQEERGWGTEGDHARVWLTCGHDCMVPTVQDLPNYCPSCGCKVVGE